MQRDNYEWKESWSSYWNQHQGWYQDQDPQWSSPEGWRQSSIAWRVAAVATSSAAKAVAAAERSAERQGRYRDDSRHHRLESRDRPCSTETSSTARERQRERQRERDFWKESIAHDRAIVQRRHHSEALAPRPDRKAPARKDNGGSLTFLPCKLFLEGRCTKGSRCPYAHTDRTTVCANPQCNRPRQYNERSDWDKCCKKCHTSNGLFHEEWCKGHWW